MWCQHTMIYQLWDIQKNLRYSIKSKPYTGGLEYINGSRAMLKNVASVNSLKLI